MGEFVIEVTKDRFQGLSKAAGVRARMSFLRSCFHRRGLLSLLIVLSLFGAAVARADSATNAAGNIVAQLCPLLDSLTEASVSVAQSDRTTGSTQLGLTISLVDGLTAAVQSPDMMVALGNRGKTLQKCLSRFQGQVLTAKSVVDNSAITSAAALKAMLKVVTLGQQLKALVTTLPSSDTVVMVSEVRSGAMTLHYAGDTVCFHVYILNAASDPSCGPVTVSVDRVGGSPSDVLVIGMPDFSSATDFCLTMGPDAGTVQVTVSTCNQTNSVLFYDYGVPKKAGPELPAPADLNAPTNTFNSIELAWSYNAASAAGFKVERSPTPTGPWTSISVTNSMTYVDTGLSNATIYYYRLRAYNSTGYSLYSNEANGETSVTTLALADTTPPSIPSGVIATAISTSQVSVSWNASTDSGGSGLAGYQVYRNGTLVTTTTATSYGDSGLSAATSYCYTIVADDNAGNNSSTSPATCATTLSPASTPPAAPSNLAAMVVTPTSITIDWQNNADNELGFQIQRATSSGGPWSVAGTVGTGVTSYTDTGLDPSTTYYYEVAAFN
jgi:Fibronectin type III domain